MLGKKKVPIALFDMVIQKGEGDTATMKPHHEDFHWRPTRTGEKAIQLTTEAEVLQSTTDVKCITKRLDFVPTEKMDFITAEATLTNCHLLRTVLRATDSLPNAETSHLFQLNHVRIIEPAAGATVTTETGGLRLWVPVVIEDYSGQVELRMREKAALEFSGLESCNQFCEEVRIGGLNFPVLASIRVLVRKQTPATEESDKQIEKETNSASEHNISAVIMEATEQLVGEPKALPNASMHYLGELMKIVCENH